MFFCRTGEIANKNWSKSATKKASSQNKAWQFFATFAVKVPYKKQLENHPKIARKLQVVKFLLSTNQSDLTNLSWRMTAAK